MANGKQVLAERTIAEGIVGGPTRRTRQGRSVTVNLAESPVTWLHARGYLTQRQLDAGERLRADWERAQLGASVTMRWDPVPASPGHAPASRLSHSEAQISARDRLDGAMAAAGRGLTDILWRVACACEPLGDHERQRGWPARSGKLVLAIALDRVADFYRLPG